MSAAPRKRAGAGTLAPRLIRIHGCNVIKDSDLAMLFGMRLSAFYARIGSRLGCFEASSIFRLPRRHARGRSNRYPLLAFDSSGVLMIAAMLADDASLEIGLEISTALTQLQTREQALRLHKQTVDLEKLARTYEPRAARLQERLYCLWSRENKRRRR